MDSMSYLDGAESFRDFVPRGEKRKSATKKCSLILSGLVVALVSVAGVGVLGFAFLVRQRHGPDDQGCYSAYKRCFIGWPQEGDTAPMVYKWQHTKELGAALLDAVTNKPILEPTKHSFHVSYYEGDGEPTATDSPNAIVKPLHRWLTEGRGCRIGFGIGYNNSRGEFTIGVSGKYLVYNHVTFQVPPDVIYRRLRKGKGRTLSFSQVISIRRATRTDKFLQDTTVVTCPHHRHRGGLPSPCHVTTQAGIIQLDKNDVLTLEASPIEYVLGNLESTYFGSMLVEPD